MKGTKIISCLIILIGIITMMGGCGAKNDDNVNSDANESAKLLIKETTYDGLDEKFSEVMHLYDSNGSREEKTRTIYYINDAKAITTSFHTYSDDGNKETTASKEINIYGVESYSRTDYEYDSSGNLILQSYSSGSDDGSYNEELNEFEYYPNGIKKTHTLTLGSYTITTEFNLNESGDRIESCISNWNSPNKGINFNLKTEYLYNSDSRNTEQITYAPDGSIKSKTEYAYDSDGDIIEEINYSSDDSGKTYIIDNKIVYEYVTVEEWKKNYSEYKKEIDDISSNVKSNNAPSTSVGGDISENSDMTNITDVIGNVSFSNGDYGEAFISFYSDGTFVSKNNLYEGWGNMKGYVEVADEGECYIITCYVTDCNFKEGFIGGDVTQMRFIYDHQNGTLEFVEHNGSEQNGGIGSMWLNTVLYEDKTFIEQQYTQNWYDNSL